MSFFLCWHRVQSCNAPASSVTSSAMESDELAELLESPDNTDSPAAEDLEGATVHGYIELPAHFGEKQIELREEMEEDSKQNVGGERCHRTLFVLILEFICFVSLGEK